MNTVTGRAQAGILHPQRAVEGIAGTWSWLTTTSVRPLIDLTC
jgi:hypothetical protein